MSIGQRYGALTATAFLIAALSAEMGLYWLAAAFAVCAFGCAIACGINSELPR